MTAKQQTLKTVARFRGRGLHTGEESEIALRPAEEDEGIIFSTGGSEIKAIAANVRGTNRGTSLHGATQIHTVEHLLAAIAGMGLDNVRIEISGPEVPAADGSALPFVEIIEEAGIQEQSADARVLALQEPVWASQEGKYVLASPGREFKANALVQFSHPMIGEQAVSLCIDPVTFKKEIAPARTFCTSDEIEAILSQGLGKGGTEGNVIVVHDDRYSVPLRFSNEFVRHKVLDLIGDLSLVGCRLKAEITAIKSSHALNVALIGEITRKEARGWQGG